jgi:hypothetical protein
MMKKTPYKKMKGYGGESGDREKEKSLNEMVEKLACNRYWLYGSKCISNWANPIKTCRL